MLLFETERFYEPGPETANVVRLACLEAGLILLTCGSYNNVIHWVPPLIVTQEQIDEALGIFAQALKATSQ